MISHAEPGKRTKKQRVTPRMSGTEGAKGVILPSHLCFEILHCQHTPRIDDCDERAVAIKRQLLRLRPHRVPTTGARGAG